MKIKDIGMKHRSFLIMASIAIVVHVVVFLILKSVAVSHPEAINSTFPMSGGGFDSVQYTGLADNIQHYGSFSMEPGPNGAPETFRTPAYPFFIAVAKSLTGTLDGVSFFQIILLVAATFMAYLMSLSFGPEYKIIALVSSGLFLFDPSSFFSAEFVASECLYTFFLMAVAFLLIQKAYIKWPAYALAGVTYGLSALVRPSGLYMLIPIGIWAAWRIWKSSDKMVVARASIAFLATAFVVVSPWYVRNGIRTGVYALSSLDAYNSINFNLPVYLSYKSDYKVSIEDVRTDLHHKIGDISDEAQMDLRNSPMIKSVVWQTIKPSLFGYALFHISKTVNFFLSPGLKFEVGFVQGLWQSQPDQADSWHPQTSLVNSMLDGRWRDVFSLIGHNLLYLPESLFLLVMFTAGIYWYWRMRRSDAAVLIFGLVFFLAILTSPISNPRYRMPVAPFIYFAGVAGVVLIYKKFRNETIH